MERMISIVIPVAKNRRSELKELIPSIKRQKYKNYEIIVEDESFCGHNKNKGAARARGDILLFLDSDLVISDHMLQLVNLTLKKKTILVYTRAGAFVAIHRKEFIPFDEKYIIAEDNPWFTMMEKKGFTIEYLVENRCKDTTKATFTKAFRNGFYWQRTPEMQAHRVVLSAIRTIASQFFVFIGLMVGFVDRILKTDWAI